MEDEPFASTSVRVFAVGHGDPEEGRTFVWANTKWFERLAASNGAVEFVHLADSEHDFHAWLAGEEGLDPTDLNEIDRGRRFYRDVIDEFWSEAPLYPEAPEASDEEPFREERTDAEEARGYHVEG